MSPETTTKPIKLCPTCGTRVSEDAQRCLVCGADLTVPEKSPQAARGVQGSRMPTINLSLPAALGLLTLFLAIGAVLVYFAMRQTTTIAEKPTASPTATITPTASVTPTLQPPTPTDTPLPSPTPFTYKVKANDTCSTIAYAFKVSIQSIVLLNNLPASCNTLSIGQNLLIPQPTPTPTPLPTSTLSPADATEAACEKFDYTVKENDTLSSISLNYNVPTEAIKLYNGLVNDIVRSGQKLVIPLCARNVLGPTPTPTLPPPYPAPNLLLPADGATFMSLEDILTLQWAAVGTLRENEIYAITVEDITEGLGRKLVSYANDTKLIMPISFRSSDSKPHIYRWWVQAVRQTGTDDEGNPLYESAGATSAPRVFIWLGGPSTGEAASSTATPAP